MTEKTDDEKLARNLMNKIAGFVVSQNKDVIIEAFMTGHPIAWSVNDKNEIVASIAATPQQRT